MPTIMGPISKQAWGRIWARAFLDSSFREKVQLSPLDAVTSFFGFPSGTSIEPLYHTDGVRAHHCIKEVYEDLEALRDSPDTTKKNKPQKLADKSYIPGDADLQPIINSLHGNEWVLMKKDLNNPGQILWIHRDQHPVSVSTTSTAADPLTQLEWARVYAQAVVDEVNFKPLLQKNPTAAIAMMATLYSSNFPARSNTTFILTLNSSAQLLSRIKANTTIPSTEEVQTQTGLDAVLQRLALGIDDEYEVCLNVCLSC